MNASLAKQFQLEAVQHSESLSTLISEAAKLTQAGRANEALGLYQNGLCDLQAFQDKWDAQIASGDASFADWWRQHITEQRVSLLTNEGLALRWMGKLDDASALFERALAMSAAGTSDHAFLLDGIGGIRYNQQSFAEAEDFCQRAHAEYVALASNATETAPDSAPQLWSQAVMALANSAHASLGRGDHADFEKSFNQAMALAEQQGLPELADKLWLRLASYMLANDASGETIQRVKAERVRRCSRSRDDEFKLEALALTAEFWRERGELEQAREELEEARAIAPLHRQWALLRQLADIAETQADIQAANDYSQEALALARQLGNPQAIAASLRALVSLHAEKNPVEAERYLSELRTFGEMDEIKNALLARATVYFKQKQFAIALRDIDEAERAMPGDAGVLLARVAALRGMDSREEALVATEKAAAAFREQIRESGADWRSGFDSLGALHEGAAFLAAELERTDEAFAWAEHGKALRLRSRFVGPADAAKAADISYAALRERLRAESARLLLFSVTHRGTLALLCAPDFDKPRAFFFDLTEQSLASLLPSGLQDMPWNTAVFNSISHLSEKLAPCLNEATGGKENGTLYIVPDSQLYFIPFAALDVDGSSKLIDHCAVVYLPCAAMLVTRPRANVRPRTCLAAGAGEEHAFSFSEQAAQIATLSWETSECLKEAKAQEFLSRAPQFDVLHLQCHGQMEGSLPGTRSASILELGEQTRLSAMDVYGLSLKAQLVFLNACVSGRFQSRLASEVGGFWEAFLHAGAGEIIVTLAYVHPESAQRLALAFYRHWLSGKTPAGALREAQLEIRRQQPNPSDWAAHILIG